MRGTTNVPSVYVILRRNGNGLFVLRSTTGFKDGEYTLPSGHVEGTESFIEAALRETKEEVGIELKPGQLRLAYLMHRYCDDQNGAHVRVDVFFEADGWEGEPVNNEPDVHSEIAWFDMDDLPLEKIIDWQSQALGHIAEGGNYGEFGWR
jgi:8-oxo-dGTP diphosphatase